ncbi:hypothetical protein L208DRAFT_1298878, partial [Tricholoma matsutake]
LGSLGFAAETGQQLNHFLSQDTIPSSDDDETTKRAAGRRRLVHHTKLTREIQQTLWNQPPCRNSKLIPAKLLICVGMPIMIRHNVATELCMTKGQEATVYGWEYSKGTEEDMHLETLFLKLMNPTQSVQLPDLPLNVMPLVKTTTNTHR